jgi:hypothetical protein
LHAKPLNSDAKRHLAVSRMDAASSDYYTMGKINDNYTDTVGLGGAGPLRGA